MTHFMKLFTFRQRLFLLFLIIFTVLSFFVLDKQVLSWITPLSKPQRHLAQLFSHAIFPPFYLVILIGAFLFARLSRSRRHLTLPLFEIVTAQCLSVAVVRLSKILIGRARPDIFLKKEIYGFHGFQLDHHYHSFPSGHTMAAFTLATSLGLLYPHYRVQLYLTAFILSLSRVLSANHYLSDILGTACIGMIIAMLTHSILEKITDANTRFTDEKP